MTDETMTDGERAVRAFDALAALLWEFDAPVAEEVPAFAWDIARAPRDVRHALLRSLRIAERKVLRARVREAGR